MPQLGLMGDMYLEAFVNKSNAQVVINELNLWVSGAINFTISTSLQQMNHFPLVRQANRCSIEFVSVEDISALRFNVSSNAQPVFGGDIKFGESETDPSIIVQFSKTQVVILAKTTCGWDVLVFTASGA